ncbi:MAG: hypothetical protein MUP85_12080 [Candidatus Lokiarchaeota archaeon]|nr:hypothetical protein [Candidatus Lokiarchaeota archaeon]
MDAKSIVIQIIFFDQELSGYKMKKIVSFLFIFLLSQQILLLAQDNGPIWLTGSLDDISMNPVYSPDGTMIAFTKSNYVGLYIYNLADGSISQISDEISAGYAFKWSSDSRSILSRVARYDGPRGYMSLKVFDVASGKSGQISEETSNMPYLPQWSSGNDQVFLPQKDGLKVFQSGKEQSILERQNAVVVYTTYDKIIIEDIANSDVKTLEPLEDKKYLNVTASPDGAKIAFEVYGGNLFVMHIDGTDLIDLDIGYNPKWSADSKSLVYMITEDDGHTYTASDIFTINADGTNKRNITNTTDSIEMNPSISPDGKTIVYDSFNDGAIYYKNIE